MSARVSTLRALAVGDAVELVDPPARRPPLRAGQRGLVVEVGEFWGLVTVAWESGRRSQLHAGRLRRLDAAPRRQEAAPPGAVHAPSTRASNAN